MISNENKKKFIINVLYVAILCTLFYLFMKYAFGIFLPFAFAFILAAILQKPVNAICKTDKFRGVISTIFVLSSFVLIIGVIIFATIKFGTYIASFGSYIIETLRTLSTSLESLQSYFESHLSFLPHSIKTFIAENLATKIGAILGNEKAQEAISGNSSVDFSSIIAGPLNGVWDTAKKLPSTFIAFIISIVSCCFLTSDFNRISKISLSFFKRETAEKIIKAKTLIVPTLKKLIRAYLFIIVITFTELIIGFVILSLFGVYNSPYIPLIALLIALIDIIPVLGTGTVLIPWVIIALLLGDIKLAIGLFIMYVLITIIRQIIEPKLVAKNLNIPPFLSILSMYIGLQCFGFIGVFLMPITVTVIKLLNDNNIINLFHKHDLNLSSDTTENQNIIPEENTSVKNKVERKRKEETKQFEFKNEPKNKLQKDKVVYNDDELIPYSVYKNLRNNDDE